MPRVIRDYRERHEVPNAETWARWHKRLIAQAVLKGKRVSMYDVTEPVDAFISDGEWLIQCECGAGNSVDPAQGLARCGPCGAVHTHVVIPDDREAIEAVLMRRPRDVNRNWLPGETVAELERENVAHGVMA